MDNAREALKQALEEVMPYASAFHSMGTESMRKYGIAMNKARFAIDAANVTEAKQAPVVWYITDDNGKPFASTVYSHEAQQWIDQGKQVHESFAALPAQADAKLEPEAKKTDAKNYDAASEAAPLLDYDKGPVISRQAKIGDFSVIAEQVDAQPDDQARKVRHAYENIRNNYVGWSDDPNFKVIEKALFGNQVNAQDVIGMAREAVKSAYKFDLHADTIHMTHAALERFAAMVRANPSAHQVNAAQPQDWTISHNGKSVTSSSLVKAAVAAASLRTEEETRIAAENLMRAIEEDAAQPDQDAELLDWLNEQVVETIHFDDGSFVDVRGIDARKAIRAAIAAQPASNPTDKDA